MTEINMGRTQMKIMQALWKKKRASAQEITDTLNESEPVSHSSVQTFLRILLKNKAVGYDVEKRTFVYYPLLKSKNAMLKAVGDFVDNIFKGSPEGVISYIIKNMDVTPDQLKRIKDLIEEEEK